MRFRVKRILRGGKDVQGVSPGKEKNKARGVICSSRLGAYLDGLPEHKEPYPVFPCAPRAVVLIWIVCQNTRNRPLCS